MFICISSHELSVCTVHSAHTVFWYSISQKLHKQISVEKHFFVYCLSVSCFRCTDKTSPSSHSLSSTLSSGFCHAFLLLSRSNMMNIVSSEKFAENFVWQLVLINISLDWMHLVNRNGNYDRMQSDEIMIDAVSLQKRKIKKYVRE